MAAKSEPEEPRRLGRYALHGELASGGMAVVHYARLLGPVGFARTVAIKRLHRHLAKDSGFRAMFLDEARLAARVRHPNVVPILDVVHDGDELYLVMEYVHGESFDRLLKTAARSGGVAPISISLSVIRDVLHGLHAAHEATSERGKPLGIVHRDVSPHNVLVGVDGVARVHDFGVAKAQARMQLTAEGQLKGKIAYMAPEQVEQSGVDRRSDIWAASVVLWEALTAKRLFTGDHPAELMKAVLGRPVPDPRQIVASIPPSVAELVQRGLDRDRERRYVTAHQMAVAIDDTGLCAPQHVIGEWVQAVANKALRQHALALAEIEGSATATGISMPVPDRADDEIQTQIATSLTNAETVALSRPPHRGVAERRRWLVLAAVATVAASAGAAAVALLQPAAENPAAVAAPAPAPTPSDASSVDVVPAPSAPAAVPDPSSSAKKAPQTTPPRRRVRAPARDACNPPWTVDKDGIQVPKLNCF